MTWVTWLAVGAIVLALLVVGGLLLIAWAAGPAARIEEDQIHGDYPFDPRM